MFGLMHREQLPEIVSRELDGLVIRIKKLFTQEHNDDGTHRGANYSGPISGITNITIENGIITEVS